MGRDSGAELVRTEVYTQIKRKEAERRDTLQKICRRFHSSSIYCMDFGDGPRRPERNRSRQAGRNT
jgi:hypothetical protein